MTHVRSISTRRARRALGALAAAGLMAVPAIAGAHAATSAHSASATVIGTDKVKNFTTVLAASNGHVLYVFDKDTKNHSKCSGKCAKTWKPLLTTGKPTGKSGAGLKSNLFGTDKLSGGKTQATYNGHPLYEYSGDKKAGQLNGQGRTQFGGDWYVIGPKGKYITCNPGLVCTY